MKLIVQWLVMVAALTLSGCGAKDSVSYVSLSFGEGADSSRAVITPNTFSVTGLVIETMPTCGGPIQTIQNVTNPATQIPVCSTALGTYPRLAKMQVQISGQGQGTRTYQIDLSKPEQMPAELKLTRSVSGNGIKYQLTDLGGAIQSSVDVVSYFLNAGLAVSYDDDHYLESLTYEKISEGVIRAHYNDCSTCIADLSLSSIPASLSTKNNVAGSIDFDTTAAVNGTYNVGLAVKQNVSSTFSLRANISLKVSHVLQTPAPVIEALQVYQAGYNHGFNGWDGHTRGVVTVNIAAGRPIYLVVSAYEPVQWNLVGNVQNVIGVYVHGYYAGAVSGVAASLVTGDSYQPYNQFISVGDTPYGSTPGYVVNLIASRLGYAIDSVQGGYDRNSFTIPSSTPLPPAF